MKRFNIIDIIIILILTLFSITGIFYGSNQKEGNYLIIYSPEGEYSYSLKQDRTLKLNGKCGEYIIQIKNGEVSVIETHCPKKICQRFKISHLNDSIVCPPNMIMIKITGEYKGEIDGITE
ncbi:MAG: NusG domain II-containing protein [Brevinematia bacterium]